MLRDNLAVTVSYGRATTHPEGAKMIVVRIIIHVANILIGFLLLYQPFLFVFLVDLSFEHCLVVSLLLLSFQEIRRRNSLISTDLRDLLSCGR